MNGKLKKKSGLFLMVVGVIFCMQATVAESASGEVDGSPIIAAVKIMGSPQQKSIDEDKRNSFSDQWVTDGWDLFKRGDNDGAIKVWQQGVSQLSGDRMLLFAGVFRIQEGAIKRLHALGENHNGIMIQKDFQGSPAFYVLAAPSVKHLSETRLYLRENLAVNHPKGRKALFFQSSNAHPKTSIHQHVNDIAREGGEKRESTVAKQPAAVAARSPELDVDHLFSMARKALTSGHRSRAKTLLSQVLIKQPALTEARLMYVQLQIEDGDYEKALLTISPLLTKNNADWHPWFWHGTTELMLGHLDQAASSLDAALARDGRNAAPWVQRALVEQLRDHHAAALQMLEMAELSEPGLAVVQLNIGVSNEALGHYERALMAYNAFLRISSGTGLYMGIRINILHHITVLNKLSHEKSAKP